MTSLYVEGFFLCTVYSGSICSKEEQRVLDGDAQVDSYIDQIYELLTPEIRANKNIFYKRPTLKNANKMDLVAFFKVLELHTQLKQRLLELFPQATFKQDGELEIRDFIEMCQDVKNGKIIERPN